MTIYKYDKFSNYQSLIRYIDLVWKKFSFTNNKYDDDSHKVDNWPLVLSKFCLNFASSHQLVIEKVNQKKIDCINDDYDQWCHLTKIEKKSFWIQIKNQRWWWPSFQWNKCVDIIIIISPKKFYEEKLILIEMINEWKSSNQSNLALTHTHQTHQIFLDRISLSLSLTHHISIDE